MVVQWSFKPVVLGSSPSICNTILKVIIFINNESFDFTTNLTIIQYLKLKGFNVPRFCYHEKLNIAGNCRMCLIEIEGISKPITSCTMQLNDNISIFTDSVMVRKARQGILEFLLLSHPLDCPVCDQGGECDLQDQTLIYGSDRGRFFNLKKSSYNFDLGPFVKTEMTRCINCTRCIRFIDNFLTSKFNKNCTLGHMGRGAEVYIGQYIHKNVVNSFFIGNIIDLCPVGALTSKPSRFNSRNWEEVFFENFDIFDTFFTKIKISIRDNKIMKILPLVDSVSNSFYNEWISDFVRFSFDGYYLNRIINPIKCENSESKKNLTISWDFFFRDICAFIDSKVFNQYNFYLGEFLDLEILANLKDFFFFFDSINFSIFDNLQSQLLLDIPFFSFRNNYLNECGSKLTIDNSFICFTLGVDLRVDMPVYYLNLKQNLINFNSQLIGFGIKSLTSYNVISNNLKDFIKLIEGKSYLCYLKQKFNKSILFYSYTSFFRFDNYSLHILLSNIRSFFFKVILSIQNPTLLNFFDLGLHPTFFYKSSIKKKEKNDSFNIFLNTMFNRSSQLNSKKIIRNIYIYIGSYKLENSEYFDYILPNVQCLEKTSTFVSIYGKTLQTKKIISIVNKQQWEDWNIISYLLCLLEPSYKAFNKTNFSENLNIKLKLTLNYNYYISLNSINYFIFLDLSFFNYPFFYTYKNTIYNSNLIIKNSMNMNISYNLLLKQEEGFF